MATIVGNPDGNPDHLVQVDVTVRDENDVPVEGASVKLEDRGGTPDDRLGTTDTDGQVTFYESVGPPPCNTLTVKIEDEDLEERLGCHDGGTHLEHTFVVPAEEVEDPPMADGPVDGDTIIVASVGVAAAVVGVAWINSP